MSKEQITMTYIGRAQTKRGGLGYQYLIDEGPEEMFFSKKIYPCSVGGQFSAERTEAGVKGPHKFIGWHKDQEQVSKWTLDDRCAHDQWSLEKDAKRPRDDKYQDAIQVIRDHIMATSPSRRRIARMRVIMDLNL